MSYTLHIWNPASTMPLVNASLAEVADRLEQLVQVPATDADRALFSELADRLWQHYPSADDPEPAQDIFEGNLPSDAPTVRNRLWTIGIDGGNRLRVLRDVAENAKIVGLAVYDDQIGIGFDPKIGVIPKQRASEWQDVLDGLRDEPKNKINKAYVRKQVLEPLINKLVKIGFQIDRQISDVVELVRKFDDITQRYSFSLRLRHGLAELHASFHCTIPELVRLRDMISEGKGGGGLVFARLTILLDAVFLNTLKLRLKSTYILKHLITI
jgi:hypothetical protein